MKFTVYCNNTNPVPYKRTTQKQKFVDAGYKKYMEWKNKVYADFVKAFKLYPHQIFKKNEKIRVDIIAYYKDKKHADTDNVAKGINDSIFQKPLNDKYVVGSYDFFYDKTNPRVEIQIS